MKTRDLYGKPIAMTRNGPVPDAYKGQGMGSFFSGFKFDTPEERDQFLQGKFKDLVVAGGNDNEVYFVHAGKGVGLYKSDYKQRGDWVLECLDHILAKEFVEYCHINAKSVQGKVVFQAREYIDYHLDEVPLSVLGSARLLKDQIIKNNIFENQKIQAELGKREFQILQEYLLPNCKNNILKTSEPVHTALDYLIQSIQSGDIKDSLTQPVYDGVPIALFRKGVSILKENPYLESYFHGLKFLTPGDAEKFLEGPFSHNVKRSFGFNDQVDFIIAENWNSIGQHPSKTNSSWVINFGNEELANEFVEFCHLKKFIKQICEDKVIFSDLPVTGQYVPLPVSKKVSLSTLAHMLDSDYNGTPNNTASNLTDFTLWSKKYLERKNNVIEKLIEGNKWYTPLKEYILPSGQYYNLLYRELEKNNFYNEMFQRDEYRGVLTELIDCLKNNTIQGVQDIVVTLGETGEVQNHE